LFVASWGLWLACWTVLFLCLFVASWGLWLACWTVLFLCLYLSLFVQRELPWQPNLGKNKPELHKFQFCIKYWEIVCVNSRVFRVVEFKCAIEIFKGAKGVAMATQFRQISTRIALISVLCKKSRNFSCEW